MMNRYPYSPAHVMVAVRRHAGSFAALRPEERGDVLELVALAERALEAEYRPNGMNVGANLGEVAGAGFPGHLHVHLVPRWKGDTNFMPVIGDTRVLPESLARTWTRLRRALRGLDRPVGRSRPRG
jgi:ATP adenylyltransferase